jgi:hypothetical protein
MGAGWWTRDDGVINFSRGCAVYIAGIPVWVVAFIGVVAVLLALYVVATRPRRARSAGHAALLRDIDQLVIPERMANPDSRPGVSPRRPLFAR